MDRQHKDSLRKLIAKIWSDPEFKAQFLKDPKQHLNEAGIPFPDDRSLTVLENTADNVHLILPEPPTEGGLTDDQLNQTGFFEVYRSASPGLGSTPCCDITVAPSMFDE